MEPLISFNHMTCGYDDQAVLEDITLQIMPGQFVGLVGPSGSGKTTLLRTLMGMVTPAAGSVEVLGQRVQGRAPARIGYVPQLETVDWNFPVTVEEVVLMGRTMRSGIWPWPNRETRAQMATILDQLGIGALAKRHIRMLSGGQQQRVFLARALLSDPKLLLLDEPTSNVDIRTRDEILHLLADINRDGIAVVLTTHELNSVATHLPWVICLNRAVIAQGRPNHIFTTEVLSRTFNAEMMVIKQGDLLLVADRPHGFADLAASNAGLEDIIADARPGTRKSHTQTHLPSEPYHTHQ
ncbi:MAG: metal ABC transporter ATP-binding protein [Herpetosiphonaceae bacterium]|nr:metal ABC transporter ATP-binding protein [Herpetosiphonaceae bacterium]